MTGGGRGFGKADMACRPWVDKYHENSGKSGDFPAIASWRKRVAKRPAVQCTLQVGEGLLQFNASELKTVFKH